MPIKLPKAFPRRKSSGNALEDIDGNSQSPPAHEGFRLLSRDEALKLSAEKKQSSSDKSMFGRLGGGRPFSSPQKGRQHSFEGDDSSASNRGSNGSSGANSTLSRVYDTSSSSARFSSTSTLPSTDADFSHDSNQDKSDPHSFSVRGARTFTFGSKSHKPTNSVITKLNMADDDDDITAHFGPGRERASTTSTYASTYASTAVPPAPPKLDDDLSLSTSDFGSGFGDLFGDVSSNRKSVLEPSLTRSGSEPPPTLSAPSKAFSSSRVDLTPLPIRVDRSQDIEPPPHSWDSRKSTEALMASPSYGSSPTLESAPPVPRHTTVAVPEPVMRRTASHDVEDTDAKIVMASVRASRASVDKGIIRKPLNKTPSSESYLQTSSASSGSGLTPPTDSANISRETTPVGVFSSETASNNTTPRAKQVGRGESLFDGATAASAAATMKFAETSPLTTNKRMTARQFSQYRKQRESQYIKDESSDSEDDSDAFYEDDEAERLKEAQKQRARQQANLSVLRQQMQKISGGAPNPEERPSYQSRVSFDPSVPANPAEEESSSDEDIPLAILNAHGFPKKNKEPARPQGATPGYVERPSSAGPAISVPGRPASTVGSVAGRRMTMLPPFARNLPADPYFGAGIVTPANRESLAFGGSSSASVYGGQAVSSPYGGLIGVIDSEQRAKAARRGTPNAQGGYGPVVPPPVPMMGPPPANPQMEYMTQMMANMQMMQQQLMAQMAMQQHQQQMGGAPMPPVPPMPHMPPMPPMPMMGNQFLSPQPANPMSRPMSHHPGMPQQRAMSMVNLARPISHYTPSIRNSMMPQPGAGYTPSLAPSERSNVGMASRYRPVASHNPDGMSTISSHTVQPGVQPGAVAEKSKSGLSGKIKGVVKPKSSRTPPAPSADEEDEEGWGASVQKRKSKWLGKKTSKETPALKELYFEGL